MCSLDYETIIVDDASPDDSPRLAAKLAAENPRIRVITHTRNQKLGATLRSGFAATTKELIFYMDADIPFDPEVLGNAIRAMHVTGADMIDEYRHDRSEERRVGKVRKIKKKQ